MKETPSESGIGRKGDRERDGVLGGSGREIASARIVMFFVFNLRHGPRLYKFQQLLVLLLH